MVHEVFELFRNRASVPWILLAFLIVGTVVAVERFVMLQFLYRVNFKKFNENMRKMLPANDFVRAKQFCEAAGKVGLPLIVAKAIDMYESDPMKVRGIMSEEILAFLPKVRRRLSQLPNLAAASVLLGALASVNGVWDSFESVSLLDSGIKSIAFSQGIGHALVPLGLSLFVSVLLMVPHGILEAISLRLEAELEHSLTLVANILAPDAQPIIAAPIMAAAGAGGGAHHEDEHSFVDHDDSSSSKKVELDEPAHEENLPDEEEII